jgi:prepilin-type N-terminal cleavage/methylation domain-containing protein
MVKSKSRGFSLLELLIVVAIILIIATIAIPSLLRSRQAANESGAVATLRTVNTAQITYMSSQGGSFSGTLAALVAEGLLDDRFDSDPANVGGFTYAMTQPGGVTDYQVTANPISTTTARFNYYSLPDAVVRYGDDADNPQPQGTPVQ